MHPSALALRTSPPDDSPLDKVCIGPQPHDDDDDDEPQDESYQKDDETLSWAGP